MTHRYFITGTDTDVGKTYITTRLLAAGAALGLRVQGIKPIAAGAVKQHGQWVNDDAAALQAASNTELPLAHLNPVVLPLAASPHLAAAQAGQPLSVTSTVAALQPALSQGADITLVEGAGGWLVPINHQESMADLALALNLPVIMVVAMRLGCLNHALLTAQGIQQSGLTCAGWIANSPADPMPLLAENLHTLEQRLSAPCLGVMPPDGDHRYLLGGVRKLLVV